VNPKLDPELLEAATREWLEALRTRSVTAGSLAVYSDDLALATTAGALVDADRAREGVLMSPGELTIERLLIDDVPDPSGAVVVDLDATLVFPPDVATNDVATGRASGELTVPLGSVYFEATASGLLLVDYTRNALRMSAMWCTHPEGEDARGGLAAVPQAVTLEAHRGGRVFVEVSNALERDVVLRVGRPDRPRGLFTRPPAIEAPDVGIPVPAGGNTHFAGLTRRSRLTEVEIFAFDAAERTPVASLLVQIELPKGHPGELGQWCA
jgi:hypothetical protein